MADSFDLLADLQHPTGLSWREQRRELVSSLHTRNHSLFAHGFAPVDHAGWLQLWTTLGSFLHAAVAERSGQLSDGLILEQLPSSLEELLP